MRTRHHLALAHLEGLLDEAELGGLLTEPLGLDRDLDPTTLAQRLAAHAGPLEPDEEARLRVDVLCDAVRRGRLGVAEGMMRIARVARASWDELPPELVDEALALDAALERPAGELLAAVADAEASVLHFIVRYGRPVRDEV